MNKITYYLSLVFMSMLLIVSCQDEQLTGEFFSTPDGSDPDEFCMNAAAAIVDAQVAFANATVDQQAQLCNDLITIINNTINSCGDQDGSLQQLLDNLGTDCNVMGGDGNDTDIVGNTYLLTSFMTTSALDLNEDGNASTDFLAETMCLQNETLFFDNATNATATSTSFVNIFVDTDSDGNLTQVVECMNENTTTPSTYTRNGNEIIFDDLGIDVAGIISGNQIIFTLPQGLVGQLIDDTGTGTFELTEEIVQIYTLQ